MKFPGNLLISCPAFYDAQFLVFEPSKFFLGNTKNGSNNGGGHIIKWTF